MTIPAKYENGFFGPSKRNIMVDVFRRVAARRDVCRFSR
jgi:hypothetical protein